MTAAFVKGFAPTLRGWQTARKDGNGFRSNFAVNSRIGIYPIATKSRSLGAEAPRDDKNKGPVTAQLKLCHLKQSERKLLYFLKATFTSNGSPSTLRTLQ
jgi:hypothetical protein